MKQEINKIRSFFNQKNIKLSVYPVSDCNGEAFTICYIGRTGCKLIVYPDHVYYSRKSFNVTLPSVESFLEWADDYS